MKPMHETTLSKTTIYTGKIIRLETQEVELETGQRAHREIVRHRGAVAVIAVHPDGSLLFVRQFRKPVEQIMLEVVAGLLDENEKPEAAAVRELHEETGYEALTLRRLGHVYPTPGYVDEKIVLFVAHIGEHPVMRRLDHDERIELVTMTEAAFRDQMRRGEISDGKTLAAWALYEAARTSE